MTRGPATVEADDAFVDLGPIPWQRDRAVDGAIAEFLAAHGRPYDGTAVTLAEVVLKEGDRVVVSGPRDEVVLFDGLRGAQAVPAFRDWPVIRKL